MKHSLLPGKVYRYIGDDRVVFSGSEIVKGDILFVVELVNWAAAGGDIEWAKENGFDYSCNFYWKVIGNSEKFIYIYEFMTSPEAYERIV